jgi:hypothetical protein
MAVKLMVANAIARGALEQPAPARPRARSTEPRARPKARRSSVYDSDGHEVFITLMCLKCRTMRPLSMFGLRKMADGAIRNQPWCRTCRSASGEKPVRAIPVAPAAPAPLDAPAVDLSSAGAAGLRGGGIVAAEVAAALAAGRR